LKLCLSYGCVELDTSSVDPRILNNELKELRRFEEMCDNAYYGYSISSLQRFLRDQCYDIYIKNTVRSLLRHGAKVISSDIPISELQW